MRNASKHITKWLGTILMLFAIGFAGCGQRVEPYGAEETVYLAKDAPAPFAGWLLSDADLEALLKAAEP